MENLKIEAGKETPGVFCDAETGEITLRGNSYPEDAFTFYEPVLEWTEGFVGSESRPLTAHLTIDYINSSSSKSLFDLLDLLDTYDRGEGTARVKWYYPKDDEDALEMGEEFQEDLSLPFELIPV